MIDVGGLAVHADAPDVQDVQYEAVVLEVPPGEGGRAFDINVRGEVVGTVVKYIKDSFGFNNRQTRAAVWKEGGISFPLDGEELPEDAGDDLFGRGSEAVTINNAGQILGQVGDRIFLYDVTREPALQYFDAPEGHSDFLARALDKQGRIIASAYHRESQGGRVILIEDGNIKSVSTGARTFAPTAVNRAGVVAGYSISDRQGSLHHAAVWKDGELSELTHEQGFYDVESRALGINDRGVCVGILYDKAGSKHHRAVIWSEQGQRSELPGLADSDVWPSAAHDVSNQGSVVGGPIKAGSGAESSGRTVK